MKGSRDSGFSHCSLKQNNKYTHPCRPGDVLKVGKKQQ